MGAKSGTASQPAQTQQINPNAILQQVLLENKGMSGVYNPNNVAITLAPSARVQAKTNHGNQLEYWPPDEQGDKSFPRPSGYDGKHVLEIYSDELKRNPAALKQAIYGDLLHGMVNDPQFSGMRKQFVGSYLPNVKSFNDRIAKERGGNPNSIDDMYIRGYLSPDANDEFRKGEQRYSPQQLELLEKMRRYIATGDPSMSTPAVTPNQEFQYVKLPDGSFGKFRADATPQQMRAAVESKFPDAYKQSGNPAPAQPSTMDKVGGFMQKWNPANPTSDIGIGQMKGVGHTIGGVSKLINKIPGIGETLAPQQGIDSLESMSTPHGAAEKTGKFMEQSGEFLLPGPAEEKLGLKAAELLPKIGQYGKAAIPVAKAGIRSLSSGLINKAQGGDFTTGAGGSVVGSALAAGGRAVAPKLVQSALRISGRDMSHGATPGQFVLDELNGVSPEKIGQEASAKVGTLNTELETAAKNSTTPASKSPALGVLRDAHAKARAENSAPMLKRIGDIGTQLTRSVSRGQPLPNPTTAENILNLKRGVGSLVKSWPNEEQKGIQPILKRVYGALDQELDNAVPGAAELNQRMSSGIATSRAANRMSQRVGIIPRITKRLEAPTGALVSGALGAGAGFHEGGVPGAILGGVGGLVVPEVLASPTTQTLGARVINSPTTYKAGRGMALQLTRPDDDDPSKKKRASDR